MPDPDRKFAHVILDADQLYALTVVARERLIEHEQTRDSYVAAGIASYDPRLHLCNDTVKRWETILAECRLAADRLEREDGFAEMKAQLGAQRLP